MPSDSAAFISQVVTLVFGWSSACCSQQFHHGQDQRANMKFCIKFPKSATQTLGRLQQAYDNETMSRMQCFKWHWHFKSVRTSLEGDEPSGRHVRSISPRNVVICIKNSSPTARPSTKSSTVTFWSILGRTFSKSNWNCVAQRIKFFLTTMHPVTKLSSLMSFSPNITFLYPDENAAQRLLF